MESAIIENVRNFIKSARAAQGSPEARTARRTSRQMAPAWEPVARASVSLTTLLLMERAHATAVARGGAGAGRVGDRRRRRTLPRGSGEGGGAREGKPTRPWVGEARSEARGCR